MGSRDVAAAMQRVEGVLQRRPQMGIHDDAPASARWESGTRIVASRANGTRMQTDMPAELGGSGDRVTPGWMFRAGVASCTATTIAMHAAAAGIELDVLEVKVGSRSDTRGLLGMEDADGGTVSAGPCEMRMDIRIGAAGVAPERLRELVAGSQRCAPMATALRDKVPMDLRVEVE